jgi:hypothetical protein
MLYCWRVALAALLALGLLVGPHGGQVRANGEPVEIDLRYLEGVSNFGPRDATGRVRIVKVEGDVRLTASKLPPQPGARYEGWIVNTRTGERRSVGKFNAAPDGTVTYTTIIDNFGEPEFDLFIVTLEPEPDPSPAPDARVVLAGRYVPLAPPGPVLAVPRPGPTPGSGGPVPVVALPRTGAPADPALAGALAALAAGLGALAFAARRR